MTDTEKQSRLSRLKSLLEKIVGPRLAYPVLCALPVVLALAIFIAVKATQNPPIQNELGEMVRVVRVIEAPVAAVVPRAIGYGTVEPEVDWKAMSEVQGAVVYMNPNLKSGAVLPKGTDLLEIDPTDYQLAVERLEATVATNEARVAESRVQEANIRATLEIEESGLKLARENLDRKRRLFKSGNVSQAALDTEERNFLTQQRAVQTQRNSLALIPVERKRIEADLVATETQLDEAKRDLERTLFKLPFDAKIGTVDVEQAQVVMQGQMLLSADSIDVAEIKAQIPVEKFMGLVQPRSDKPLRSNAMFTGSEDAAQAIRDYGLKAIVRFHSGNFKAEWDARFSRFSEAIDPQTRTVGIIVAVDDPLARKDFGRRAQLSKNMYVEVELQSAAVGDHVVVPQSAIHDGSVYVLNAESRLEIRPVTVGYQSGNFAVIREGLQEGEQLVVTDLIPAIPNMLLRPETDLDILTELLNEAEGKGAIK